MAETLHYIKEGSGRETMILFHGFGQNHQAFESLIPKLTDQYTVYTFDLYYHGKSTRPDKPLRLDDWISAFSKFLKAEKIERFSITGFSLGGRFALASAAGFPNQTKEIILIAPDGIYKNFWYLFTTSLAGNWLFKYLMMNPDKFENWTRFFSKYKLASPSMIRFAQKELQDHENCFRVYRTWTYFRPLQQSVKKLARTINQKKIPLRLFLGSKDYIIPANKITPKLEGIQTLKVKILPLKHHQLIDGVKDLISSSENANKL